MNEGAVYLAAGLATGITILIKTVPITFLKGAKLPVRFRLWLDYVPVAVMAALVGPDIFVRDGRLDLSTDNLFLIVSLPTLAVAIWSRNYFITIAVGIALVIGARWFGIS